MKRSLLGLTVLLFACSAASADLFQVGISYTTAGNTYPYAAYQVTAVADAPDWLDSYGTFDTFCLEYDVTFDTGTYYATIDDEVLGGGSVGTDLSDTVKKVYAAYVNGYLTSYTNNQVQYAIWKARGYSVSSVDLSSILNNIDAIDGWECVKALNLWSNANGTGDVQSQLVMTPVPVPSAIMLGVLGLGVANRRLKRRFQA